MERARAQFLGNQIVIFVGKRLNRYLSVVTGKGRACTGWRVKDGPTGSEPATRLAAFTFRIHIGRPVEIASGNFFPLLHY